MDNREIQRSNIWKDGCQTQDLWGALADPNQPVQNNEPSSRPKHICTKKLQEQLTSSVGKEKFWPILLPSEFRQREQVGFGETKFNHTWKITASCMEKNPLTPNWFIQWRSPKADQRKAKNCKTSNQPGHAARSATLYNFAESYLELRHIYWDSSSVPHVKGTRPSEGAAIENRTIIATTGSSFTGTREKQPNLDSREGLLPCRKRQFHLHLTA